MDDHPDPLMQFFTPAESETPDILYTALSIPSTSTGDEIKRAYRNAALRLHPDKHASKSEAERERLSREFQKVGFAYAVLGDQGKRKRSGSMSGFSRASYSFDVRADGRTGMMRLAERMIFHSRTPSPWDGMRTSSLSSNEWTGRCWTTTKLDISVGLPFCPNPLSS